MEERHDDTTDTDEVQPDDLVPAPPADEDGTVDETTDTDETFPRSYVEKLRDEAAKYRQKAQDRDDLAQRLHKALVSATGRLADPDDLNFSEDHLTDPDALSAALDALLDRKPHLASRRPVGDVGQGVSKADDPVDLAGMLRRNAS